MQIAAPLFDPVALAIVVGGTIVGTVLRSSAADLARSIAAVRTLVRRRFSAAPLLAQITAQGRIARGHGVLALDRARFADPDIADAFAAIVDGADGEQVAAGVARARHARIERHLAASDVWAGAADLAPAMGMIGTLVGLVRMFAAISDPAAIGGAMAIALLATLYGAVLANLVLMPIATRLRAASRVEAFERQRLEEPLMALATREAPRPLRSAA